MPGAASVEGTRRYAQRAIDQGIPASAYRGLGRTGLVSSSLGFGSYRIDDRTPEHASALDKALRSGVNLIDTSTNYTDGSSESCIGNVLARQQREELIVISKVGYVQGQTLATARTREQRGSAFPEMVKYTGGCWHCIHPEFLADQLGRSLGRLRVEKVDVYLLHNPEYFFTDDALDSLIPPRAYKRLAAPRVGKKAREIGPPPPDAPHTRRCLLRSRITHRCR